MIKSNRIIIKTAKGHSLHLDIFEIQIKNEPFDKDEQDQLHTILFECQCALFLLDITSPISFESIRHVIKEIDNAKFPFLTKILVSNKCDMESSRAVSGFELKEYTDSDNTLKPVELNLKDGDKSVQELMELIYEALSDEKKKVASNIVSESITHQKTLPNAQVNLGSLRIVLLGDSSVGKTAFLGRYFKNTFNETFLSTIGIDDETTFVKVNNDLFKLTVWDTAGQERFRSLPKKYYQNADGILLLFDVTNQATFDNVKNWMKDISENTNKVPQSNGTSENSLSIFLLGNKIDMVEKRVVSQQRAAEVAKSLGMKYYEISCKLNLNIPDVMYKIILECYKRATGVQDVFQLKPKEKRPEKKNSGDCCGGDKEKKKK